MQQDIEDMLEDLFQSTLPEGSDLMPLSHLTDIQKFQSTLPEGSDSHLSCFHNVRHYFNPHSPKGVTEIVRKRAAAMGIFQSTLPEGSDPEDTMWREMSHTDFNPHSPKGVTHVDITGGTT